MFDMKIFRKNFLGLGIAGAFCLSGGIAAADVFTNVPEVTDEGYQVLYELNLPADAEFRDGNEVSYSFDISETFSTTFDRVGYYLELTKDGVTTWVYVSMDAFTDDPVALGIPHNVDNPVVHQRTVRNLNVFSNVDRVTTGTFLGEGHVEMWPGDASRADTFGVLGADDDFFDWGDGNPSGDAGYGSFQVHNPLLGETIFAYNRWGRDKNSDDVGIGTQPLTVENQDDYHPDWTNAKNANQFDGRKLMILVRPKEYEVELSEFPRDRQLFSREVATGKAVVPVAGKEVFGGYDSARLEVWREGVLAETMTEDLVYVEGEAAFSFSPEIVAELAEYRFDLYLEKGGESRLVERAQRVVAGDAFLFYGQSNAEARAREMGATANVYASPWIRTFGQNGDSGADAENILIWAEAEGDGSREDPASIGQWAMVLARMVVDEYGIPVAVINGSRGAASMLDLQKDAVEPDNLYDGELVIRTYNRMFYRAKKAGIAETARAMFFYQGEADRDDAVQHVNGFANLWADWEIDYPGLEHVYLTQVRPGCGPVNRHLVALREAQRSFADVYPNTSIIASNGLDHYSDDCHFPFVGGYEELGIQHFRQVSRDLYAGPDGTDIDALNPAYAEFTDSTRRTIRLVLRNVGATVNFPVSALSDFRVRNPSVGIEERTVSGHVILLELEDPAPVGATLEYWSHEEDDPFEWVTNGTGMGLLSFRVPVGAAVSVSETGTVLEADNVEVAADGAEVATVSVRLRDEAGIQIERAGVEVTFTTTLGSFADGSATAVAVTDENGRASAALVSGSAGTAEVTASVFGAGEILNGSPLVVNFVSAAGLAVEVEADGGEGIYVGEPFSVRVIHVDGLGDPVAVESETGFSVSVSAGDGILSGELEGVIAAGESETVFVGLVYSEAEEALALAVSETGEPGTGLSGGAGFPVFGVEIAVGAEPNPAAAGTEVALGASVVGAVDTPRAGEGLAGVELVLETDSASGGSFGGEAEVSGTTDAEGGLAVSYSAGTGVGSVENLRAALAVNDGISASVELAVERGAALLAFQQQPADARVGAVLAPAVTVAVVDELGNVLTDFADRISLALGENPGGATLGGTVEAVEVSGGVATFADLSIDVVAAGYTLVATSEEGLASAVSEPFAITVPPPISNPGTGEEYASLQEAFDAAADGDVVEIWGGLHGGDLTIDKDLVLAGDFSLFHSFGSVTIGGEVTLAGRIVLRAVDVHVADGGGILVPDGAEVVFDGTTVGSDGRFGFAVQAGADFAMARSLVENADFVVDSGEVEIYDNVFAGSTMAVGGNSGGARIFHNLVDAAGWMSVAAGVEVTEVVDGWGNVTDVADSRNFMTFDLEVPEGGRTKDEGGNLFVQPGDSIAGSIRIGRLSADVGRVELMAGWADGFLSVEEVEAVGVWSLGGNWPSSEAGEGRLDLVFEAAGAELVDQAVGDVSLLAGAEEGHALFFFRIPDGGSSSGLTREARFLEPGSDGEEFLTPFTVNSGLVTIDGTAPEILFDAGTAVTQSGEDMTLEGAVVEQGILTVEFSGSDALAGLEADGASVRLVSQENPETAIKGVLADALETEAGNFGFVFEFEITAETPNGIYNVVAEVADRSGNLASATLGAVEINKNQVAVEIALQGVTGGVEREVTVVFTNSASEVLGTRTVTATFSGNVQFVISKVPEGATSISAKSSKHLRKRIPLALDANGQGAVAFTNEHMLLGGDLFGNNVVGAQALVAFRAYWGELVSVNPAAEAADITGDGVVGTQDLVIFRANFGKLGDPE